VILVSFAGGLLCAGVVSAAGDPSSGSTPSAREGDVHYTMDYADGGQVPVPPEAISPFEPRDTTYVDEPLIELDSDWNMDVKLFSRYRYTNEFVEAWRAKYGYTPTRPVMTDAEFFTALDLDHPGLAEVKAAVAAGDLVAARTHYLSYQMQRPRAYHLKLSPLSAEAGEAAVEAADEIRADPDFPACRPGMRFSLWGLMRRFEQAYLHSGDAAYAKAWLEMFDYWYVTHRPPAQRPKMYISFIWMPYWRTLGAGGSAIHLCDSERWLAEASELGLDRDAIFNVYKSLLEHAQFLRLCNDVFMPSNWQTCQCEALVKIGTYFPSFTESHGWCEHAWLLTQEHMVRETYDDGTHCENSVGYATGVINQYRNVVRLVRKAGGQIPAEFRRKWKSMYLWAVKIVPPTGNYVPCGDNGIGADGSFVKNAIVKGALEFNDPAMKFLAECYPEDVTRTAEEQFENTTAVLGAYNRVAAQEPSYSSVLLPDAGWAMMRESWDSRARYLFFDYGWDEAWHSHPDFGTFNIWAYGKPIVTECGRGGSYEADISKRWYKQTIAHNTVMVDSRSMRKCVDNRLEHWWTGPEYDFAGGTSDGYRWIGVLHNRRVLFVKPDYWIVTDFLPGPAYYGTSFQTSGYHEFDWLAHFQPTDLVIDEETKRIDTSHDDANVALVPLNAEDVEIRTSAGPVATTAGTVDASYISLHQEGMAFKQYQVLLLPYEGTRAPAIEIVPLPADETDRVHRQNVGYELALLDRRDVFLESGRPGEMVVFGEYEFRGDVAHIRDAGDDESSYLVLNCDHLAHNGTVLFSAPKPVAAIEFGLAEQGSARGDPTRPDRTRRDRGDLILEVVTAEDASGMRIFAPGVTLVTLNGAEHDFARAGDYVTLQ
jgi:heparan-sulfate lyase